jgi:hypothetical protein
MKTPNPSTNCIHSSSKRASLLCLSLLIGCLELLPKAQAVSPPPDGGYPNGNTAEGDNALLNLTTGGGFNTAVGFYSLQAVTDGQLNTAIGAGALALTTGDRNTATGAGALLSNMEGDDNTAIGAFALVNNTLGFNNTAVGASAMVSNTEGRHNTAVGVRALYSNTEGRYNTAVGRLTLESNTDGGGNTGIGNDVLPFNTSGVQNTAIGFQSLFSNMTGNSNVAIGALALAHNNGRVNTALGYFAGFHLTTGNFNIDIAADGVAGESNTTRIGTANFVSRAFIAGIRGVTTGNNDAVPVVIDSAGQLGTVSSSSRFKTDIKPIEKASESILSLQPVSFRYKAHKDTTPNFGLIAEEVARVNPDLVIYDADGKPYTVRYDAVNAMLLNEFLKEHRKVQELETNGVRQQKQIEELTAGLQRVTAQIETSRSTPHVVVSQQ